MVENLLNSIVDILKTIYQILLGEQILIYQMAKVGSSSLEEAIKKEDIPVKHIHSYYGTLNYYFDERTSCIGRIKKPLFKLCFKLRKKELKVITIMRDPIARNISALFQSLYIMIYKHQLEDNKKEESFQDMMDVFMEKYVNTDIPLTWFDRELKEYLGIDVLKYKFNKESGYTVIKQNNINLLVLTTERINENTSVICNFLGLPKLKLNSSNRSSSKWYSEIYKQYVDEFSITDEQIDYFYKSPVIKHFYSDKDIDNFIDTWSKNSIGREDTF